MGFLGRQIRWLDSRLGGWLGVWQVRRRWGRLLRWLSVGEVVGWCNGVEDGDGWAEGSVGEEVGLALGPDSCVVGCPVGLVGMSDG